MSLGNQYNDNLKSSIDDFGINKKQFDKFKDPDNISDQNSKWKGIALWLIENTAINFEQIANFCGIHILQIEAIANGEVNENIKPINPISEGIVDKETIDQCNENPSKQITTSVYNNLLIKLAAQKGKFTYTTITKKKNKPDAIAWLIKNYPFISDAQIIKLIGTTKTTVDAIRNNTYKGMKNLKPKSPVSLSLCTNEQLEIVIMNSKILYDRMQIEENN